jgi:hypothetical protein
MEAVAVRRPPTETLQRLQIVSGVTTVVTLPLFVALIFSQDITPWILVAPLSSGACWAFYGRLRRQG